VTKRVAEAKPITCDDILLEEHTVIGMAIGPRSDGHPQKIPAIGRVKPRFLGYGHGYGYPQI